MNLKKYLEQITPAKDALIELQFEMFDDALTRRTEAALDAVNSVVEELKWQIHCEELEDKQCQRKKKKSLKS